MDGLQRIMALVDLMRTKQKEVERLEDKLKDAKATLLSIERVDIPDLMSELGVTEIKTADGATLSIKEEVDAKITEANRWAAMDWLAQNGFAGIIKTGVSVAFGKGDHDGAVALADELTEKYGSVEVKEEVHPSTLKSFVKERLAAGDAIPFDIFGIFPYSKAVIKEAKR